MHLFYIVTVFNFLFNLFGFPASKDCYFVWFSNIMTMSEPDEGYYRNSSCALH